MADVLLTHSVDGCEGASIGLQASAWEWVSQPWDLALPCTVLMLDFITGIKTYDFSYATSTILLIH